jgi:2-iminobutanoate/2-iminopropanoate deaminase
MIKQIITTNRVARSSNPFSLGVKVDKFIFISGQVGKSIEGDIVDGFTSQVRYALENLRAIVEDAKCTLNDVVKVNIYLTDISQVGELNEIYKEYFTDDFPARSVVEVSKLGLKAEVEIDAVVYCG